MKQYLALAYALIFYCLVGNITANNEYTIEVVQGSGTVAYAQTVLQFITENFQGWPYFIDINQCLEEEKKYIAYSQDNEHSLLAIAKCGDQIVGLITGSPFKIHDFLTDAATLKDLNAPECYYYGEVMVQQTHRGNHLVTKMFEQTDQIIKNWGYKKASLITVIRSDDDLRKPDNALNSGLIWQHCSYKKTDITLPFTWPTFTDKACTTSSMIENELVLWIKDLQ